MKAAATLILCLKCVCEEMWTKTHKATTNAVFHEKASYHRVFFKNY